MKGVALILTALCAALLLATPALGADLGSDPFQNISPESQLSDDSLRERNPLSHYELDQNVDVSIDNLGSIPALVAQTIAAAIWSVTKLLSSATIDLFTWAFSLDLLSGKDGALNPVADAIASIYDDVLGQAWLVVAILAAGLWGIWRALIQRRYTETAGALAVSVLCVLIALFFVHQPERTVGQVSNWTNELSLAFLGAVNGGSGQKAKGEVADHLFRVLVYEPWAVLDFGGLEHCTDTDREVADGYPRPVGCDEASADTRRDVLVARGGRGGYAERFLKYPAGSDPRRAEFNALRDGELPGVGAAGIVDDLKKTGKDVFGSGFAGPGGKLAAGGLDLVDGQTAAEPEPGQFKGYSVDRSDSPAVDIQQAGGAFSRLALSALIFVGNLGAVCLIGFLSLAVILSQVFALVLLAFAPVALVVSVYPGRGHEFFRSWLIRLFSALLVKAAYSLVLAIVLAVGAAVATAAGELGFLFAYGLEAVFFWGIFIYRRQIVDRLLHSTVGGGDEAQGGAARAGGMGRAVLAGAGGAAGWAIGSRVLGGKGVPGGAASTAKRGKATTADRRPNERGASSNGSRQAASLAEEPRRSSAAPAGGAPTKGPTDETPALVSVSPASTLGTRSVAEPADRTETSRSSVEDSGTSAAKVKRPSTRAVGPADRRPPQSSAEASSPNPTPPNGWQRKRTEARPSQDSSRTAAGPEIQRPVPQSSHGEQGRPAAQAPPEPKPEHQGGASKTESPRERHERLIRRARPEPTPPQSSSDKQLPTVEPQEDNRRGDR